MTNESMKVKELIKRLSELDQEKDIWIGYDYPHDVQEPDFREFTVYDIYDNENRLRLGDYIHFAE